jgi:hypothetical protein
MDFSASTPRLCPQCQHPNSLDVCRCEQCQNLLQPTAETGQPVMEQATIPITMSNSNWPASGDGDQTVSPQLEDAPSANHEYTQTAPIAVTLPSLGIDIDPHRPTPARLQHASSHQYILLTTDVFVWRLGKPHQGAYPDLDLLDFPQSEIVSRSHALIRYHRGQYYIEDTNSSNGTYVNNQILVPGRHYPLNHNDCITLGKGDLVRFFFQICAD